MLETKQQLNQLKETLEAKNETGARESQVEKDEDGNRRLDRLKLMDKEQRLAEGAQELREQRRKLPWRRLLS